MNSDPKKAEGYSGTGEMPPSLGAIRVCPVCQAPLTADTGGEFCPICMLRSGLDGGSVAEVEGEPFTAPIPSSPEQEFEHYELALSEEGIPVELGRGAMGVTYKAFDLELRCPVALKVIGEKYVSDEAARRRFLREARAAASLRHQNVASVFHLGRIGENYFYAMEFVEGETLEQLIKRSGPFNIGLALEITSQVASGLAAVHKQNLIHRDIKPSNIMVSLEGQGAGMVKIIDLGLAKALGESLAETAISTPGVFAGTPEFASPEQFKGTGIDIRSDLYSLGITLWVMVTGQVPYRGPPGEVMYQHQHGKLPVGQLSAVPQPIVVLLEVLLEKNPAHRFQNPNELLEALTTVRDAVFTGRWLMKTVRVNVSSTSDVQKERNLADRLLRSIAGEFNLPVSASDLNFQRLVEANLVFQNEGTEAERAEHGSLILCPSFFQYDKQEPAADQDSGRKAAEFDLTICIVWSRLGPLPPATLRQLGGQVTSHRSSSEAPFAFDPGKHNPEESRLSVYRNCANPTPPLEPKEEREAFGRDWDELQDFFANWEKAGAKNLREDVHNYRSLEEFEELFRKNFRRFLANRFRGEGGQTVSRRQGRRWNSSPFRGLNVFSFEHSPIFHGRTKAVGQVLEALEGQAKAERPFVMVVGASGSGKSSLVQAGVLPLLTQPGTIEGIGLWRRAVTRPGAGGGGDCFDALAAALLEPIGLPALQDPESMNGTQDLARELRDHSDSVALRVRDALDHAAREWKIERHHELERQEHQLRASGRPNDADLVRQRRQRIELPKARLALVVDQLEELFTTGFSTEVRQNYVAAIADLVRGGRVFVLATLRSDFYPWYQKFPELIELTRPAGKVDLRPPTAYEIGEIIRLPAETAGLHFEEEPRTGQGLDEALRDAASATPESLPLLEHVLSLLYDEQAGRGDNLLLWSDYRELGELQGALAKHAERAFGTLRLEEQNAFPLVMRYLVTLSQGEEEMPNRRTVPYRDFIADEGKSNDQKLGAKGFVDLFIQKRLLVADIDPQGEITVSVAHEALLREWQRVREWLSENREFLRMRDRLETSLKLWLSRKKQKDDLLPPGLALAEAEKLAADFRSSLSEQQADYIRASIAERRRLKSAQERTRYAVIGGITAALIMAVIFGVVSFRQFRRAEKAKNSANQAAEKATLARSQAENLVNFMTVDLRDKLRPIGKLDLLDAVKDRVEKYHNAFNGNNDGPEILRNRSIAWINDGDLRKDRGDLAGALRRYEEAVTIQRKLAQDDPKNAQLEQDLCGSLEKIGDVFIAEGNVPLAQERFEEALGIRQKLISMLQLDLSLSYADIGYILSVQGDSDHALEYSERALSISETLLKAQSGNTDLMRYKNTALSQIGHEWLVLGDHEKALDFFQKSLDVTSKLVARETNAIWQRDYSISLERIGDVFASEGKWSEAFSYYQHSHTIRLPLANQNPENSTWQSDLYWTYQDLGDVEIAQNEMETALANYNDSLEIAERLVPADHTNKEWQSNLAIIREKEGDAMARLGRFAEALQNYQKSLNIAKRLTESDPTNYEWQSILATAEEQIAETLAAQGNVVGALEKYRDSLFICEKLVKKNPKNVLWAASEGLACSGLAMLRSRTGDGRQSEIRATLIHAEDIFLSLQHRSALDARCQNRLQEVQSLLASF